MRYKFLWKRKKKVAWYSDHRKVYQMFFSKRWETFYAHSSPCVEIFSCYHVGIIDLNNTTKNIHCNFFLCRCHKIRSKKMTFASHQLYQSIPATIGRHQPSSFPLPSSDISYFRFDFHPSNLGLIFKILKHFGYLRWIKRISISKI